VQTAPKATARFTSSRGGSPDGITFASTGRAGAQSSSNSAGDRNARRPAMRAGWTDRVRAADHRHPQRDCVSSASAGRLERSATRGGLYANGGELARAPSLEEVIRDGLYRGKECVSLGGMRS